MAMLYPVVDQEAYNLIDSPQTTGTPERRLLLAILERAILDFVGNDPVERAQAEGWIFEEIESPSCQAPAYHAFTFSWICLQLDLDVFDIARTIRAMPRRGKSRVAPWYLNRQASAQHRGVN